MATPNSRAAALLLAACLIAPTNASAQRSVMELGGRTLAVSPQEQQRLSELGRARTMSRSYQERALVDAERVSRSADARHVLALYQLDLAAQWSDDALRLRALDVLIAAPNVPREKLAGYLSMRGGIAYRAGDHATAASAWERALALRPDDAQAMMNLAQARQAQGDAAGAVALIRRAVAVPPQGTGPAPEQWHRQWMSIAFNAGQRQEGITAALALVSLHPTQENWRSALSAYRQLADPQGAAEIETLRLMRTVGGLTRAAEYQRFSQLLLHGGSAAEARAVLEEGIANGVVSRDEAPTPQILGEIGRGTSSAVRGRADAAPASMREGVAHHAAGRLSQAAESFRIASEAADSAYADIARFWLIWLARAR